KPICVILLLLASHSSRAVAVSPTVASEARKDPVLSQLVTLRIFLGPKPAQRTLYIFTRSLNLEAKTFKGLGIIDTLVIASKGITMVVSTPPETTSLI
ncbi:hypothetical protein BKA70DRAFT_1278419, partial [Coprinopsis sp. MPI-PUGE-AT-0042]